MAEDKRTHAIMARMKEHLVPVLESGMEWVGLFLQDSQNYNFPSMNTPMRF